jgi:hypothetical protein
MTTLPAGGVTPDATWTPDLAAAVGDDDASANTGIFSDDDITDAADFDPRTEGDQ